MAVIKYQFKKELLDTFIKYKFKGVELFIPKQYDEYLSVYYSNWKVKQSYNSYARSVYTYFVDRYKHHNKYSTYENDKFLFLNEVSPSSFKLNLCNVFLSMWSKK